MAYTLFRISLIDLCFLQEHWLLHDQLHLINNISPDFLSVSVCVMDNSELVCGRPFGGCSILYQKSPASCITPLDSCSNRFCGVKFNCSSGLSMILVCVYMPSSSSFSYFTEYLNTLGEINGFIHSYHSDVVVVVGDFNVDFDRWCQLTNLLCDFIYDHSLCFCDLLFKDDVLFTYKRDDGLCRSWIGRVLCSQSFSSTISNVCAVHSGSILSDHFTLTLEADRLPVNYTEPVSSKKLHRLDWT